MGNFPDSLLEALRRERDQEVGRSQRRMMALLLAVAFGATATGVFTHRGDLQNAAPILMALGINLIWRRLSLSDHVLVDRVQREAAPNRPTQPTA